MVFTRREARAEPAMELVPLAAGEDLDIGVALPDRVPLLTLIYRLQDLPSEDFAPAWQQAAEHFLQRKVHIGSVSADARMLGLDRNSTRECRMACAGLSVELERHFWASVEERIMCEAEEGRVEVVAYMEFFCYDGVDLSVGTRQQAGFGAGFEVPVDSDPEQEAAAREEMDAFWREYGLDTEQGPAKLMNSTHSVALLLKEPDGKHWVLQFDTTTWIQSVDRYTGETIKEAMKATRMGTDLLRDRSTRRVRMTLTDAAGYNLRGERNFPRSGDTALMHIVCDVHAVARLHGKVFALMDPAITGSAANQPELARRIHDGHL